MSLKQRLPIRDKHDLHSQPVHKETVNMLFITQSQQFPTTCTYVKVRHVSFDGTNAHFSDPVLPCDM